MQISKENVIESLIRFIKSNNKYPTKKDCRDVDYLCSYQTCLRLLGPLQKSGLLEKYGKSPDPRFCRHCGKELSNEGYKRNNVFCSTSCAASYNNPRKPKKNQKECLNCKAKLHNSQNKYCNVSCQAEYNFKLKLALWLETGEVSGNKAIRKFLTYLDGYFCKVCGISDWNDKSITLEVEHIDGNSENNNKDNVCLICPNCHSQTDTYKGKNKGFGRFERAKRYKEGKSY